MSKIFVANILAGAHKPYLGITFLGHKVCLILVSDTGEEGFLVTGEGGEEEGHCLRYQVSLQWLLFIPMRTLT